VEIRVLTDGPYVVEGDVPLGWRTPVHTEHGEPIAWQHGAELEHPATYSLCRCGGSSNKPFCDGTHARAGFDGSGPGGDHRRAEALKTYEGPGIVVRDDRSLCVHAGFCGNRVTNVWKMARQAGDTQVRAQIVAMVERCPSGALSFAFDADQDDVEPDLPRRINIMPDGPLWVTGGVPVRTGGDAGLEARNRVTLCRCGGSKSKPLCDGSHKELGFSHSPRP
jgi:CDGSH-type Zn-finger protein